MADDDDVATRLGPQICTHLTEALEPDPSRTMLRPFMPGYPDALKMQQGARARAIVERVLSVNDEELLARGVRYITSLLDSRHRNVRDALLRRFEEIKDTVPGHIRLDDRRRMLIAGFFSEEYAFETAALFNPSIVRHWDQPGDGGVRFILSLRGIGEGHVSSVSFRTGTWNPNGKLVVDKPSIHAISPTIEPLDGDAKDSALCVRFEDLEDLSEAVLFPMVESQKQGIEDLRLVRFADGEGAPARYIGTYTAYSGREVRQELLLTDDFRRFTMRPLDGPAVHNKGMALFPRKIDGKFVMLGRQDNESIWIMRSDDLFHWETAEKLLEPAYPWEFVQLGNCGSPIEIDDGWLVITHSVGIVRNYTIGACLLDRDDPSKVLARSTYPILSPGKEDRDGYVPNVVYSCGSLVEGRRLLLPYGVADKLTRFATAEVDEILAHMA